MPAPTPTIIFDFINKIVVTAGASADADRRVQDFLKQQASQTAVPAGPPASQ